MRVGSHRSLTADGDCAPRAEKGHEGPGGAMAANRPPLSVVR